MKRKLYNVAILILCAASIILAVLDMRRGLSPPARWADRIIYVIFVVDYLIRVAMAGNKRRFLRENVFDLVAIIPFSSFFRAFRLARFARFVRLISVTARSARALSKVRAFLNTNGFKYVLILSACAVVAGAAAMTWVDDMDFPDALWWAFVTATTVGYGDLSPASGAGRVIAAGLMIVGIGLIGSLTSSITSFFLDSKEEKPYSSDRIEMVSTLYAKLNEEEKSAFLREAMEDRKIWYKGGSTDEKTK